METNEMMWMQGMNENQKLMFMQEMSNVRKSSTVALILTFFLGGIGAHRYYMGEVGMGILYTVFAVTFIPSIAAFIELFLISGRVKRYNDQKAQEIAMKVKLMAGAAPAPA